MKNNHKPQLILIGQTPPPWHGQAVATQLLFKHEWSGFEVKCIRMAFSAEMEEIGRFQFRKLVHIIDLWKEVDEALEENPDQARILLFPPASPNWIPVLRDLIVLPRVRKRFDKVIYIYHAGGVGAWVAKSWLRKLVSKMAYGVPDLSLEVAREVPSPHEVLGARHWAWTPYGVEVPKTSPRRINATGRLNVLFVGSLQEGKGVLEVLRTADILKRRGLESHYRFRLVGRWFSSEFEECARQLVSELHIDEMVEFPGQLTGDAKWNAYSEADVFFFPTHYESEAFPLVLIEALGCGLPVITTRWRGIPDLVRGCEVATLCDVRAPEQYADGLEFWLSRLPDSEVTDCQARAYYAERYLPSRFLTDVEKLVVGLTTEGTEPQLQATPNVSGTDRPDEADTHSTRDRTSHPEPGPSSFKGGKTSVADSHRAPTAGEPVLELPAVVEPVFQSPTARCFGESVRETRDSMGESGAGSGERESVADHTSTVTDRRYISDDVPSASTVIDRRYNADSSSPSSSQRFSVSASQHLHLSVYLADQNPGHDRSYGISRMTQIVLESLLEHGGVELETISSKTSQQAPEGVRLAHVLPWGTRSKWVRLLTDHFHPVFHRLETDPDIHYFPKGYLPWCHRFCRPSVVTIHDTIIQYDEDHYPDWRRQGDYAYWARMLKHTLHHADYILTVSESSKRQIQAFMARHGIPRNDITVTYEPCIYERLPQPVNPPKDNHVIHLASREPHKRTAHLIRWWYEAEDLGRDLPALHLIGTVPPEVEGLLARSRTIVKRPFLDDSALQAAYRQAMALILPSEIEGFGLPALEAYYLGTPVCYVKGTSVEEVLAVATDKGGFALEDPASLFAAMDEVVAMTPEEVRECGLKLRQTYASEKVAERMFSVFHGVKN